MPCFRWKLSDLPPRLREQAERQLIAGSGSPRKQPVRKDGSTGKRRLPNKTEADYNSEVLGGSGVYEPVVLRLPGGNYTPDWMTVENGTVTFHECKGAYRFPSESRAILAFKSAAASFPFFRFVWAQKQIGGNWKIKHVLNENPENPNKNP